MICRHVIPSVFARNLGIQEAFLPPEILRRVPLRITVRVENPNPSIGLGVTMQIEIPNPPIRITPAQISGKKMTARSKTL